MSAIQVITGADEGYTHRVHGHHNNGYPCEMQTDVIGNNDKGKLLSSILETRVV